MNTFILAGNISLPIQANIVGNHRISIATDTWQGKEKGKVTQYIQCTALLPSINNTIKKACSKGDYVTVRGEIRQNNYTDKKGNKQFTYDFIILELTLQGKPSGSKKPEPEESAGDPDDFTDV